MLSDMHAFDMCADNNLYDPSPLWSGGCILHVFQKEFQILICLTTEWFSGFSVYLVHFK